jgi:hypothetical protein
MLPRIICIDPTDENTYVSLTTEMRLPRGILVLIYKQRWDEEKTFDELKSKLVGKKAWGSSPTAKSTRVMFFCLTHNLMVLPEEGLRKVERVDNAPERKRKAGRKKSKANPSPSCNDGEPVFIRKSDSEPVPIRKSERKRKAGRKKSKANPSRFCNDSEPVPQRQRTCPPTTANLSPSGNRSGNPATIANLSPSGNRPHPGNRRPGYLIRLR